MKKSDQWFLGGLVFTATLCVVLSAIAFWWAAWQFQKPGPLLETTLVEIPTGSGLRAIAGKLDGAGAIESELIFLFGTTILSAQGDLKAGEYEIQPLASASSIMRMIRDGRIYGRRITIPEGLTSFEIVKLVNKLGDMEGNVANMPSEGSLLPETYDYRLKENKQDIITRMQEGMTKAIEELWPTRAQNLPFSTKEEAVTLASIVEKETGVASERKRVAGVFINRLRKNIALQTDPTVIYALTKGKPKSEGTGPLGRRLLKKDLEFDSPYNTYLHPGLPPGPIANPGKASLEAVLHPEEHNFIYFVADGTGGHIFSETHSEHQKNVSEWRIIRREKEKQSKAEAQKEVKEEKAAEAAPGN
ncbi:MAG: endolytic transglycosylase MltG [Alphaproteobacteria bacterium]